MPNLKVAVVLECVREGRCEVLALRKVFFTKELVGKGRSLKKKGGKLILLLRTLAWWGRHRRENGRQLGQCGLDNRLTFTARDAKCQNRDGKQEARRLKERRWNKGGSLNCMKKPANSEETLRGYP